jgi:DNA helicase-2/ATP-dependent DNA helicase PcrA
LLDLPDPAPVMTAVAGHTSVTGLVTYSSCPQRFFWTEVERLPRRPSPAARHGVEVHRRIELHHRHQVPLEDVSPDLYDLPGSESSSGGAFSHFLRSRFAQEQPLLVEMPFELYEGEMAVRGRIDAVYPTGGGWEIVDFKSGRAAVDEHTEIQLQAYAVAAARGLLGTPPPELKVTFAFLGGGVEEVSYRADAEWLEKAEDRLARLTEAISFGRFDPTPGPGCGQCDFLLACPAGRAFVSGEDR